VSNTDPTTAQAQAATMTATLAPIDLPNGGVPNRLRDPQTTAPSTISPSDFCKAANAFLTGPRVRPDG
jgi:hypothetical protein